LAELHDKILDKNRSVLIGRELTKKFETITTLLIHEIPTWLEKTPETRGEFCVMLEGSLSHSSEAEDTISELLINPSELAQVLSEHLGSKQIAEVFSKSHIMSKNAAYELALQLKNPPKSAGQ
jgi:16S rRNA (cytidine1402-2'-O)-methyltransferase